MAKTSAIQHAERWAGKTVKEFQDNKGLSEALRDQLTPWAMGVHRVLQTVDQVIDPGNPPSPESIHGQLIALGKSQLEVQKLLSGESADENPPQDPPGTTPPATVPQGAGARTADALGV